MSLLGKWHTQNCVAERRVWRRVARKRPCHSLQSDVDYSPTKTFAASDDDGDDDGALADKSASSFSSTNAPPSFDPRSKVSSLLHQHSYGSNTHTFNGPLSGTPRWAGRPTRKVKPVWILLKQETVSGSGISWARCKSAPCSRQITHASTPPLSFLQAGCPSCRPTNSVKVLKVQECSENYNK